MNCEVEREEGRGREREGGREGGRGREREGEGGRERGVFTDDLCSMMRSVLPGQPLLLACFSSHHMYCKYQLV